MANPLNSYYIVLRDTYTQKELDIIKCVFDNLREFYVIDERSDMERAKVPIERAALLLKESLTGGIDRPSGIPDRIEIGE